MVKPWEEQLKTENAEFILRRKISGGVGPKKVGTYYRFCKRCGEIYKTIYKTSKICFDCNKQKDVSGIGERWKDFENEMEKKEGEKK
jgi:hypothetical protein